MPLRIKFVFKAVFAAIIILAVTPLWPQAGYQFGQNKVHYKDFDWSVFRTEHFDVHYYPEKEEAARDAARMAERGYDYLSEVLSHKIKDRIPLILYASMNDFQQTNVIGGMIGEGTRGVTEGLRNRVVLPITGSYRQFHHVLVHELVHAFQFDIMLRSEHANRRFNPPLWVVEGMAEYVSNGMDNVTRMWMRDGLLQGNLLTVDQLNRTRDIRVYRLGQSLWHYIGETHGKDKVGELFKLAVRSGKMEVAVKKILDMDNEQLTKAWHAHARQLTSPADSTIQFQKPSEIAELLTGRESFVHRMNLVPSVSPDGQDIAYIANKNLNEDIFIISDKNGQRTDEKLLSGGASKSFEALRFFDTAISWSLDGKLISFVSKSGKDDAIYIMDPASRKIVHKYLFDELNGILSPTFSPDATQLAFVGILGGISNLYRINIDSGDLKQLTDNKFSVLHPQWSPKGDRIVFATDMGVGTDTEKLLFGDLDLAAYSLDDGTVELLTQLDGNVISPQWSPDAGELAFVSDHLGISNIFRMDLGTKELTQVTNLENGVSGITETTPAFSWSANGNVMVFSAFEDIGWHLYKMDLSVDLPEITLGADPVKVTEPVKGQPATAAGNGDTTEVMLAANTVADAPVLLSPRLPDANVLYEDYALEEVDSLEKKAYSRSLKLSNIAVGASFGGFFGSVGAAQFLFQDMLGNQNLLLSTALQFSNPLHSDFGLTYFNQGNRFTYGVQLFQSNYGYTSFVSFNQLGFIRNTFRGANGLISYPFSRFSRVELFGGFTWVDQDGVVQGINRRGQLDEESVDLNNFSFGQVGAAYVKDNAVYGYIGPLSGTRTRLSVETTTKDFQFTNVIGDYRRYFNVNTRSAIAVRLTGGASYGRDAQVFGIGGPYTYRGADFNDLLGTKFFFSNVEYRFPLLFFAPPQADFLSGAAFVDAAAAWGIDAPGFISESFQPFTTEGGFRLNDLNSAFGVGARFNLGFFALKYDLAWPTNLQDVGSPVQLFSIGTFF